MRKVVKILLHFTFNFVFSLIPLKHLKQTYEKRCVILAPKTKICFNNQF